MAGLELTDHLATELRIVDELAEEGYTHAQSLPRLLQARPVPASRASETTSPRT